MADVVKIVDSIAASPTVLLDLNGETTNGWYCRMLKSDPPRLRRSVSQNAMRDGAFVSSAVWDARTVVADLELIKNNQDDWASEWQKLARLVAVGGIFLMWQPSGASKPVFFPLMPSDIPTVDEVLAQAAFRRPQVEFMAEPFALGARERLVTSSPVVNANTGATDYYVGGVVLGDVPTPAVISFTETVTQPVWIGAGPKVPFSYPAESGSNGTDTSSVAGDATYANSAGKLVSFATTTAMATRVSAIPGPTPSLGLCRVWMRCKKSVAGDSINVRVSSSASGPIATPTTAASVSVATTSFQMVDLGVVELPAGGHGGIGYAIDTLAPFDLFIDAQRVSGSGSLGIDYVAFVPVQQSTAVSSIPAPPGSGCVVLDGVRDVVLLTSNTDPFNASADITAVATGTQRTGSLPMLTPSASDFSYLCFLRLEGHTLSDSTTLTVDYWPRYLHVRPSAS